MKPALKERLDKFDLHDGPGLHSFLSSIPQGQEKSLEISGVRVIARYGENLQDILVKTEALRKFSKQG